MCTWLLIPDDSGNTVHKEQIYSFSHLGCTEEFYLSSVAVESLPDMKPTRCLPYSVYAKRGSGFVSREMS